MDVIKKPIDEIEGTIGKYYDIETITGNQYLDYISMSQHDLKMVKLKKYKAVKLVNINGLGVGQVHFVTKDGHYLMIPWCYIISMIPNNNVI